jgi:hypothetical protein
MAQHGTYANTSSHNKAVAYKVTGRIKPHKIQTIISFGILRLPCYDFSPLAEPGFDVAKKATSHPNPTRVERRAVYTRAKNT